MDGSVRTGADKEKGDDRDSAILVLEKKGGHLEALGSSRSNARRDRDRMSRWMSLGGPSSRIVATLTNLAQVEQSEVDIAILGRLEGILVESLHYMGIKVL
ncbi:MAG: hypothetical protein HYU36_02970, partial [Planctomycetes bacterium]|nr:hypothetical protein [Planctomycetota bacterium]